MEILGKIGGFLIFVGIAMLILPFVGLTLSFMEWIYTWGETPALLIKIGAVIVGGILWFLGSRSAPNIEE